MVRFPAGVRDLLNKTSRLTQGHPQWASGAHTGINRRDMKVTTHPHRVTRLRMSGIAPPLPLCLNSCSLRMENFTSFCLFHNKICRYVDDVCRSKMERLLLQCFIFYRHQMGELNTRHGFRSGAISLSNTKFHNFFIITNLIHKFLVHLHKLQ